MIRSFKSFSGLALAFVIGMSGVAYGQESGEHFFTEEEQKYIEEKQEIRVSVVDHREPITAKDKETGEYRGLAVDILEAFQEETGMTVTYVEADDYEEAVAMAVDGRADAVAVVIGYSYTREDERALEVTEPYLDSDMVMIHRKARKSGTGRENTIAEVKGYPVFTFNPNVPRVIFNTPEECILAVRAGEADLFYCDLYSGMNYVQDYNNRDMMYFPIEAEREFRFGISHENAPVLKGLLNHTIAGVNRQTVNSSLFNNQRDVISGLQNYIYYYSIEIVCVTLAAAFLIVLVVLVYSRIKKSQGIALQDYVKSYCMLADMFGEAGLNYNYDEDKLRVFGKYADKLSMPSEIENFSAYLDSEEKEISLTRQQFEKLLRDGVTADSYDIGIECRLRGGEWQHFRLVFSVLTTSESYRRPVAMVGCLDNVEREYQEKKELRYRGINDQLTGLYNRSGAEAEIQKRLSQPDAIGNDVLLIMDVDFFKNFNDDYGHTCGDDVLKYMGIQLKETFRKSDILCRWGGDEFLVYLIGAAANFEAVEQRCERLREGMKKYEYEGTAIPVKLSVGGAVVESSSLEKTFQAADQVLYTVKAQGRDSFCIKTKE